MGAALVSTETMETAYPALAALVERQLSVFPKHESYLKRRFQSASPKDLAFCEELSALILKITGNDLVTFLDDYRWLCGVMLEEELFFRRANRYRLSTFAEAERTVYANRAFMTRYMNGVLMTQLWWANHSAAMRYFRDAFLPSNKQDCRHLEIGPGHGLFLYLAASAPNAGTIAGWDVSPASLATTRHALGAMGVTRPFDLSLVDIFEAPDRLDSATSSQFDSITFSEVLEHLENPGQALGAIAKLLAPAGRAFINAPVNSPAPDHIWLFRSPEEVVDLVKGSGLFVEDVLLAPLGGETVEEARAMALTISTIVVAKKRA